MKLLKSILILSLIVCACVAYVQAAEQPLRLAGTEPYDINSPKKIEVHNTFTINYTNKPNKSRGVLLDGTIEVNRRYKVIDLQIDYYIFDGKGKTVRATSLDLVNNGIGVYSFTYDYPLDLHQYEFELFSLVFIVEEIPTNDI